MESTTQSTTLGTVYETGRDVPRNLRVSRCTVCDTAFAWKGSAPRPACPFDGGALTTTTRMLRARFLLLEGELLTTAELKPEGLEGSAQWEENRAASNRATIARLEEQAAATTARLAAGAELAERDVVIEEEDGHRTATTYRRRYYSDPSSPVERSGGWRLDLLEAEAVKHDAKAATYRKRAAKLGAGR